jgi:hypothetical protein
MFRSTTPRLVPYIRTTGTTPTTTAAITAAIKAAATAAVTAAGADTGNGQHNRAGEAALPDTAARK